MAKMTRQERKGRENVLRREVPKSAYRQRIKRRNARIAKLEAELALERGEVAVVEVERTKLDGAVWIERFVDWAQSLIVPVGSPGTQGKPYVIHDFQREFAEMYVDPLVSLGVFSIPRKNSKTATSALTLLFDLIHGPEYWTATVASINGDLTGELKKAVAAIVNRNNLQGKVRVYESKPGKAVCGTRVLQFITSDKRSSGHGLINDVVLFDEYGRTNEDDRDMVESLKASLAIKDGKFIAISPRYDSPLMLENKREAKTNRSVRYIEYAAAVDDDPYDRDTWFKANPALGSILPVSYFEKIARLARDNEHNLPFFLAQHLNMPLNPDKATIVFVNEWQQIYTNDRLQNEQVYLGIDLGGSASMTAACAIGSKSGRMRFWGAWPDYRTIEDRARADNVGTDYQKMLDLGELQLYSGRVVPNGQFLRDVLDDLYADECTVIEIGADRYKDTDVLQMLDDEALFHIGVNFRPVGAGKDGSYDIRAFQHGVLTKKISCKPSKIMERAIASSKIKVENGNPSLEKVAQNSRIDALAAAVLAVGLWRRNFSEDDSEVQFKIWT